jgi:hypothetical protein
MEKTNKNKSPRAKVLGVLFTQAAELGISQSMVRDIIALNVNGKRLSKSSVKEIGRVIDHITGAPRQRRYAAGIDGLRHEIKDIAMTRWRESWEKSLNAFCKSFGVSHWRFLNVNHGKAVKKRLKELNHKDAEGAK